MAHIVVIASETDPLKLIRTTLEQQFIGGGLEFFRNFPEAAQVFRIDPADVVIGATQLFGRELLWDRIHKHFPGASVVLVITDAPSWEIDVKTTYDQNQKPMFKIMGTQAVSTHLNNVVTNYVGARRSITRILQRK